MRPPTFWDRLYGKWELLPFFSTKAYKRLAHPWLGMFFEILLRWVPARFKATFLLRRIILRARHWLMAEAFSEEWLDNPSNSPLKPFQKSFKVLVFTQGGKIHLPELAAEKTRVEFYLGIKQIWHSKIQFSMTLFDFIPILYPEFVTLHSGYLDYLRLLRVADKLSCISQEVANQAKCYVQILGRDQQVDVAAHLLPGDFDSLSEKQMPTSAPAERPLILCVGSIEIRKNQLALARAARALFERGYKFDLVFAGAPGWLSNEFLSEAFELRRRGFSVELLFHVPESMLRDLYSKCLLTVFPSFAEGFGLPIVESLRFGKPVIVSKKGCMGDLAKLVGGCVLVDPDSYEDIETALAKFIEKPALAQLLMSDVHLDRLPTWPQYAREVGQLLGHQ
jgi:glycosyltransferase involved in cell wall biosynthesis